MYSVKFDDQRMISDTFMEFGTGDDEEVNGRGAIDCNRKDDNRTGNCCGVSIGTTSDQAVVGILEFIPRNGGATIIVMLSLGVVHSISMRYLFPSANSRNVVLHYIAE